MGDEHSVPPEVALPEVTDQLTVAVQLVAGVPHVRLVGELDIATADEFASLVEELYADGHRSAVLELEQLSFCDARGLAVLLAAHERFSREGGELVVRGVQPLVARLFSLTGLDRALRFADQPPLSGSEGIAPASG